MAHVFTTVLLNQVLHVLNYKLQSYAVSQMQQTC